MENEEEEKFDAVNFLDKFFPSIESLKKAPEILKDLESKQEQLIKKQKILEDERSNSLVQKEEQLIAARETIDNVENLRKDLIETLKTTQTDSSPLIDKLTTLTNQYQLLQQNTAYMQLLLHVTSLNEKATQAQSSQQTIEPFMQLVEIQHQLQQFPVKHLQSLVKSYVENLSIGIRNKMKTAFADALTAIQWPTGHPSSRSEKAMKQFKEAFTSLIIQQKIMQEKGISLPGKTSLLALDLLLAPLAKRFKFHFEMDKPTNNLEKPEWYYTHVLNLISNHVDFMTSKVQPLLNEQGITHIDAKESFIKGLISMINHKLASDMPVLLNARDLFFHTINETISFEKTLRNPHDTFKEKSTCIQMFTDDEKALNLWIEVEKKYAISQVESLKKNETAWELKYKNMEESDEYKVTTYADGILVLLSNITERYTSIPNISHRLRFLDEIQLKVLKEFNEQISIEAKQAFKWTRAYFTKEQLIRVCSMVNTIHYVRKILKDWGDEVHFIELQILKANPNRKLEEALNQTNKIPSVFERPMNDLKESKNSLLKNIGEVVLQSFKDGTISYFKKRLWTSSGTVTKGMPDSLFDISPEIAEALSLLKNRLEILSDSLSVDLFGKLWKTIAQQIDSYIFEQITAKHHFTWGGAHQFNHDFKALLLLFRPFTPHPEMHFKDVKEACLLLLLEPQDIQKAKKLIADNEKKWSQETLAKVGIYKLTLQQVKAVINMYID